VLIRASAACVIISRASKGALYKKGRGNRKRSGRHWR
jgi:hypothetical protein